MSTENHAIVHELVDAWNRSDIDGVLALFHSACEVVFPPDVPEPGPFHGHAELRRSAEAFLAAWEFHHADVVEVVDTDDGVLAALHLVGRGAGSGIEVDQTDAHVFTIREGKIARWHNFNERAEAVEAARAAGVGARSALSPASRGAGFGTDAADALARHLLEAPPPGGRRLDSDHGGP